MISTRYGLVWFGHVMLCSITRVSDLSELIARILFAIVLNVAVALVLTPLSVIALATALFPLLTEDFKESISDCREVTCDIVWVCEAAAAPNALLAAEAEVAPVPPLVTGKVPVTPGLGDVANSDAALVDARLIRQEGLEVILVPPLAIGNVPEVILLALWAWPSTESAFPLKNPFVLPTTSLLAFRKSNIPS